MNNKFGIEIPTSLDERHQRHQFKEFVKKWDYCTINTFGQVEEVFCKCCGCRIMGLRDWGDPEVYDSKDAQNTLVVRQRVRVMPFNNYAMVMMEMEDGSQHLTTACTDCCDELRATDSDKLRDYYVADLASLAETASTKREMEVVDKLYERKPKRVL